MGKGISFFFVVIIIIILLAIPISLYVKHTDKLAEQEAEEREKRRQQQEEAQKTEQQKEEEQKQRQAEEQELEQKQSQQRIKNTLAVADSLSSFNYIMLALGVFGCIVGFFINITTPVTDGYKITREFNPDCFSYFFIL